MRAIVILEVMWDWRNVTGRAGYRETAPRYFDINPENHTGRRLHAWLKGKPFLVTNACPQLVSSAKGRGTPDANWLHENLLVLKPFDLVLVCGRVAQQTYRRESTDGARIIELPHPAARTWSRQGIELVHREIHEGKVSVRIRRDGREFVAEHF
jgi:hypothetical protein